MGKHRLFDARHRMGRHTRILKSGMLAEVYVGTTIFRGIPLGPPTFNIPESERVPIYTATPGVVLWTRKA